MQFVIIDLSTNYCTKGEFFLACLDNPKTCFAEIKAYMSGIYTYPICSICDLVSKQLHGQFSSPVRSLVNTVT
jgi:hypothetical protein